MNDITTNTVALPERALHPPMKSFTTPRRDSPLLDGPCHPYSWRLDGARIDDAMQPAAWKLVNHLWQHPDHAASFDDLKLPVYADLDHEADNAAFGSLRKAANAFFTKHGLAWRVGIKKGIVHLSRSKKVFPLVQKRSRSAGVLPARISTTSNARPNAT